MRIIQQEEIEIKIANSTRPKQFSNSLYPINSLDDRIFEILTYSLFKKRIEYGDPKVVGMFDSVLLMQGVGEKGFDCRLMKENITVGAIQCKKYNRNLPDIAILSELIKFTINLNLEDTVSSEKFKYFVATSTGYTGKSVALLEIIARKELQSHYDMKNITADVINKYDGLSDMDPNEILDNVINTIYDFDIEFFYPEDFSVWLNQYPEIIETFFEIKKVTDNTLINQKSIEIIAKIESKFTKDSAKQISDFIIQYKRVSVEKLNIVNFIGFDVNKGRQKPIEITLTELFVQPLFNHRNQSAAKGLPIISSKDVRTASVFKSEKHIVILGDPGAGKSLLVKFVMVKMLKNDHDAIGLRKYSEYLPLRIELRKFNEVRERKSIIGYLSELMSNEYQIEISTDLLKELMTSKPTMIFFDGLDEIFNISHKVKTKEAIEGFCALFPLLKCIVTSRFIGYHDVAFNTKNFDEFAVARFNQKQIEELVLKFYTSQFASKEKRATYVQSCLEQIRDDVDDELKSNPLIMTLILILASNHIVIPDSKLEIYEACTKTLVDSIDTRDKELKFEMSVKNKRVVFAHLAYWQYKRLSQNSIINYYDAVAEISRLLLNRGETEDTMEAEEKAKKFLEYAEKRSIYFEDNFTHKTFLEYYTADYLFLNFFTKSSEVAKKQVFRIIREYLPNPFWYIVFELLFTRLDKDQPDYELLDEILSSQLQSDSIDVSFFLISHIARLINVSDSLKFKIIDYAIKHCIGGRKLSGHLSDFEYDDRSMLYRFSLLQENDAMFRMLQSVIDKLEESEMPDDLRINFYIFQLELISQGTRNKVGNRIRVPANSAMLKLSGTNLHLFCLLVPSPKNMSIGEPLRWLINQVTYFGPGSIFKYSVYIYRSGVRRIGTFSIFLMSVIKMTSSDELVKGYLFLRQNDISKESIFSHSLDSFSFITHYPENISNMLSMYIRIDELDVRELIFHIVSGKVSKRDYQIMRQEFPSNATHLAELDKNFRAAIV